MGNELLILVACGAIGLAPLGPQVSGTSGDLRPARWPRGYRAGLARLTLVSVVDKFSEGAVHE
jgi:hypothetical protein